MQSKPTKTSGAVLIVVQLDDSEWLHAAKVGCQRYIDGRSKDRTPGHGSREREREEDGGGWFWDINGACGEKVVAKWLGVPWDGCFGSLRANDAGLLEVRTTTNHDYPLRLHDVDKDDCIYVLVTGVGPTWRIQGFMLGVKGKRQEWFSDRPPPKRVATGRPAYWVEQRFLNNRLDLLKERYWKAYGEQSESTELRGQTLSVQR